MNRLSLVVRCGLAVVVCVSAACAPRLSHARTEPTLGSRAPIVELWTNPTALNERNLRWGPGNQENAPSPRVMYRVLKKDETGYSHGYDVMDPDGRKWSIKIGREAQPEIVLSRILWALGYHQPETYYVTGWQLEGKWDHEGEPARFRLQSGHRTEGEWPWVDNPFAGTQPMHGLIAINFLLNNWDLKTSNNKIYVLGDKKVEATRRYVVQDLGASLGKPRLIPPPGTRNDITDFENSALIKDVRGSDVVLNYRGRHGEILKRLSVADLVWACELMNRLTDAQLNDAFEAAGYTPDIRQRYITKIRAKLREGLDLQPRLAAAPRESR
jgi:hypothetical protein